MAKNFTDLKEVSVCKLNAEQDGENVYVGTSL